MFLTFQCRNQMTLRLSVVVPEALAPSLLLLLFSSVYLWEEERVELVWGWGWQGADGSDVQITGDRKNPRQLEILLKFLKIAADFLAERLQCITCQILPGLFWVCVHCMTPSASSLSCWPMRSFAFSLERGIYLAMQSSNSFISLGYHCLSCLLFLQTPQASYNKGHTTLKIVFVTLICEAAKNEPKCPPEFANPFSLPSTSFLSTLDNCVPQQLCPVLFLLGCRRPEPRAPAGCPQTSLYMHAVSKREAKVDFWKWHSGKNDHLLFWESFLCKVQIWLFRFLVFKLLAPINDLFLNL